MELYFCSECGISIPQSEIESGAAVADGGRHVCSEHRGAGKAVATAVAEVGSGIEPELLFCANCRVSIPLTDAKAGRARKEYGSMLCAVCVRADPGERAARREAVEAEMTADVDGDDPVVQRCSVCNAAVPRGQIVTGEASIKDGKVVCQRCDKVAAEGAAASSGGGGLKYAFLILLVFGVFLVAGIAGANLWAEANREPAPDHTPEIARLKSELAALKARLGGVEADTSILGERNDQALADARAALEQDVGNRMRTLSSDMASLRADLTGSDKLVAERMAKLEGSVEALAQQVNTLLKGTLERPPVEVVKPDDTPKPPAETPDNDPPTVKPPDPKVTKLVKDLLESGEDSVRFPAATELGRIGDPAAIPALAKALLDDKHFLVRRACARSLGLLKAWNAVPMLIQALEDKEAYVAQQANYAIQGITGEDFSVTQDQSLSERKRRAKKARKWWEAHKDSPPEGVAVETAELEP